MMAWLPFPAPSFCFWTYLTAIYDFISGCPETHMYNFSSPHYSPAIFGNNSESKDHEWE